MYAVFERTQEEHPLEIYKPENSGMENILHLLRSEPDETVITFIEALGHDRGATVISLYPDAIANTSTDWHRLIDDIFAHDRVICWW